MNMSDWAEREIITDPDPEEEAVPLLDECEDEWDWRDEEDDDDEEGE